MNKVTTGQVAKASDSTQSSVSEMVRSPDCFKLFKPRGLTNHKISCQGSSATSSKSSSSSSSIDLRCKFWKKPVKIQAGFTIRENICPQRH